MTDYGQIPSRSSVERDHREKSQSDERSVSQHVIGFKGSKEKVSIQVEDNSEFLKNLSEHNLQAFQMRPKFGEKFSPPTVELLIETTLREFFADKKEYNFELAEEWIQAVCKEIIVKVREMNLPRYKLVCNAIIGEYVGGGFHTGMKGYWDTETDLYATYTLLQDNLFCVATVCGIYVY